MYNERLFELAFRYQKTQLSQTLGGQAVFAVRLSGDRIGYISVRTLTSEYIQLNLHIGEEGYESMYRLYEKEDQNISIYYHEMAECAATLQSLECAFEERNSLLPDELTEIRAYAKAHGISLSKKTIYPQFTLYRKDCVSWRIVEQQDQEDMAEALEAGIALAEMLQTKNSKELGIGNYTEKDSDTLLMERTEKGYQLERIALPQISEKTWPKTKPENDILTAALKRQKRSGVWQCEIFRLLEPIEDEPNQIPYFPLVVLVYREIGEYLMPIVLTDYFQQPLEEMLNHVVEHFLSEKICPKELQVADERSYAFFQALCERLEIPLTRKERLPQLEQVEDMLKSQFLRNKPPMNDFQRLWEEIQRLPENEQEKATYQLYELMKEFSKLDQNEEQPWRETEQRSKKEPKKSNQAPISFDQHRRKKGDK